MSIPALKRESCPGPGSHRTGGELSRRADEGLWHEPGRRRQPRARAAAPNSAIPIFDTVVDARRETGADVSGIFVPAPSPPTPSWSGRRWHRPDRVYHRGYPALRHGARPRFRRGAGVKLIRSNCPGLVTAGQAKVGIIPNHINLQGSVGIVVAQWHLDLRGHPGIEPGGGRPDDVGRDRRRSHPRPFLHEVLRLFKGDPATRAVVMIGEIGGSDEEAAADEV